MNNLKKARARVRMTQKEVAEHIGISQNAYSYWESGRSKIDNVSLAKLAELFDCTVDYLLGNSDVPNQTAAQLAINFQLFNAYAELSPEGKAKVDEYILFIKQQEEKAKQND